MRHYHVLCTLAVARADNSSSQRVPPRSFLRYLIRELITRYASVCWHPLQLHFPTAVCQLEGFGEEAVEDKP